MGDALLHLLDLSRKKAVSLVDVVPGLADLAHSGRVKNVAAVYGNIGRKATIPHEVKSSPACRADSVTSNRCAVPRIVRACIAIQLKTGNAGGASPIDSRVAVDRSHTGIAPRECPEAAGGALGVIGRIIDQTGRVVLEALAAVADGEGGLAGEALIGWPVEVALGDSVTVHTCTQHVQLETLSTGETDAAGRVTIVAVAGTTQGCTQQDKYDQESLHFNIYKISSLRLWPTK